MCKVGDILLIFNAEDTHPVGPHPFVVIDDTAGKISGVYGYDFMGLLMSSADTEEKRERLKKFEGNFPVDANDKIMNSNNKMKNKDSYVKADQFFYFDKNRIQYIQIGRLTSDVYNLIVEFIEELSLKGTVFRQIIDKATRIES